MWQKNRELPERNLAADALFWMVGQVNLAPYFRQQ